MARKPPTTRKSKRLSKARSMAPISNATKHKGSPKGPKSKAKPLSIKPNATNQNPPTTKPSLTRFQKDLLVLTSFNDNETLRWRPSWFPQQSSPTGFWTLHNPPNVVTERLPREDSDNRIVFTRRMRDDKDPPLIYIKDWEHWKRYCEISGIPGDFLCEEHVMQIRGNLAQTEDGIFCETPQTPLFPEPPAIGQSEYVLDPETYKTHLPRKYHCVKPEDDDEEEHSEIILVLPDGSLKVVHRDSYANAERVQGPGRKWSYIPWTEEQEASYRPCMVKLRFWMSAMRGNKRKRG